MKKKKITLCASAMLLSSLALENINVEGMEPLKPLNLTGGNGSTLSATSLASVSVPSNISAVAAAGQENANGIEQTAPAAQETVEAAQAKRVQPLDQHTMIIVSKYFDNINDYINIEKSCKEYNGIIEEFKYNPIPFQTRQERELFKNIENYHFYAPYEANIAKKNIIENDKRIKKIVCWEFSYSEEKENDDEKYEYKNTVYDREDMKKYLLSQIENGKFSLNQTNVVLEEGISSIGHYCFSCCSNLNSINIPTSVSSLGSHCFASCSNLTSIIIPESVKSIGSFCFYTCPNLSEITIPTSVSSIGDDCFNHCGLSSIIIPSSVTSIGKNCFNWSDKLTEINVVVGENQEDIEVFNKLKGECGGKVKPIKENGQVWDRLVCF